MRIILKIENAKFIYFSDAVNYDPGESVIHLSRSEEKTGTVIYAAEVVDEYPDELIALGSEDGSNYALCVHEPFLKFQESWRASVLAVKSGGVMQPVEDGGPL